MKRSSFLLALTIATTAAPAIAQQTAPAITVTGAVTTPLTLTAADLATMPRAKVTTSSNGIETVYEGVWISDVLKKAGVAMGSALRGPALSAYVLGVGFRWLSGRFLGRRTRPRYDRRTVSAYRHGEREGDVRRDGFVPLGGAKGQTRCARHTDADDADRGVQLRA